MNPLKSATDVIKKLKKSGHKAYFAGGWVRDYLLGHPSSDIDIATDAPTQTILDLFPYTILVGLNFGVVIVVYEGHQFEVASFRKDLNYSDGRKPDQIEFSTPQEDANRRDFTINGMFYDPCDEAIYDYVGGTDDLKKGIIKAIGNPYERFIEDRLRMIRAVRFACRFGFAIDIETQNAVIENADTLLPAVAMERVWQELNKMSNGPNFDHALIEMHRLQLLPVIFPTLKDVHLNTIKKQVVAFVHFPVNCPTILYLLALFPNTSLDEMVEICQYLKISNKDLSLVRLALLCEHLVENHLTIAPVEWAYFYAKPDASLVIKTHAAFLEPEENSRVLLEHQLRQESLQNHIARIKSHSPLVSASLLKTHGIPESKLLGQLLILAENISVTYDLDDSEAVLNRLKQSAIWPNPQ